MENPVQRKDAVISVTGIQPDENGKLQAQLDMEGMDCGKLWEQIIK